jgi:hypothetical protein
MHSLRIVLSRRINRNQLERLVTAGNELVLCACRNNHDIARLDLLVFAGDSCEAAA